MDRLAHPGGAGPDMPVAAGVAASFDLILQEAVRRGASDVHIKTSGRPAIRVAGRITRIDTPPPSEDDLLDFVQAALGRGSLEAFLRRRELDDSVHMAGCTWRVHAYWCSEGPAVAARRLRDAPPSMDEIGVPGAVREWADRRAGLVIVSGPTGAGKSTTLSAIVNHINGTRACHIVTIEDPIEYQYPPGLAVVTQRQVGRDTEDFATALRAVVRGDPDVILIGEMRDPESMRAALSIAEAGHLVLATLHTASAIEVPSRIVDALPAGDQAQARVQLASSLLGVVTQILLPRAGAEGETDPLKQRVAAFEVMAGTPGCRSLIRSGSFHQLASQIQIDAEQGSMPMEESLARLAAEGAVEEEVARAAALRPQEFDQRLRRLRRTAKLPSG